MGLFDNSYETEDFSDLYEGQEEVEIDDTLYDEDLMEASDFTDEDFDEGEYFLDEEIMEGAKKMRKASPVIVKLRGLMKERHAIAMQFRTRKAKKGKNKGETIKKSGGLHRQLKYLTARAKNGRAIIETKIERYQELADAIDAKLGVVKSIMDDMYENMLESLMEASELQKKYFVGKGEKQDPKVAKELQALSKAARFSSTKEAKNLRKAKAKAHPTGAWAKLAKAIKGKSSNDLKVLSAKKKYYTNQIANYKNLLKSFNTYMAAYIAFVDERLAASKAALKASGHDFSKNKPGKKAADKEAEKMGWNGNLFD